MDARPDISRFVLLMAVMGFYYGSGMFVFFLLPASLIVHIPLLLALLGAALAGAAFGLIMGSAMRPVTRDIPVHYAVVRTRIIELLERERYRLDSHDANRMVFRRVPVYGGLIWKPLSRLAPDILVNYDAQCASLSGPWIAVWKVRRLLVRVAREDCDVR